VVTWRNCAAATSEHDARRRCVRAGKALERGAETYALMLAGFGALGAATATAAADDPTPPQCVMRIGAGSLASNARVTPPNTCSRIRLWP